MDMHNLPKPRAIRLTQSKTTSKEARKQVGRFGKYNSNS
jgi:hypothetical protein